ncbi:TetR/AcrR family transcriptional regulator [Caldanaerobius polysaccharolyticus]|uniref:TetR/AcrR family transcriptional regulator n=1 Tax=Caldanaerobius polysaccharolyticus TaxID=44256 RepID=UPI00047B2A56|nr:TetR/AcrR family transcriptional regulator [Caldanaerobius polysaccharolyticus]
MDAQGKNTQSQRILNAAYECLSKRGYANVSLREIADKAGVVLSQLNYYYGNKEGLFVEVIKFVTKKYIVEVEDYLKKGETAKDKLASLITFFKGMLKDNVGFLRLWYDFTDLALWSPSFSGLLRNFFRDLSDMIEEFVLKKSRAKANDYGYSPKHLARLVLGAIFGTVVQAVLDQDEENLPEALNTVGILLEGHE